MEEIMDFTKYKCPVCNEQFKNGDDIVVCPECGAPHHRACYDELGHCCFEDKHADGFSFDKTVASDESNDENSSETTVVCPNCKAENPKELFYCQQCGMPLMKDDKVNNNQQIPNYQQNGIPNNMPPFGAGFAFDPMAGLNSNEEIAENVTAGEMSKFVGKNTMYYLRVFSRIKTFDSSKFNFAAFLLSGIYFLYRKMIGLGVLLSALVIALTVGEMFIQMTPEYSALYNELLNQVGGQNIAYSLSAFNTDEIAFLYLPVIFSLVKFVIMIISGAIANRTYFKHCTKKIKQIKAEDSSENLNKKLEIKGGVNLALAISAAVVYLAASYIPLFL
jgi:hypothetical protein